MLERLSFGQRVVVVIALAAVALVVAVYVAATAQVTPSGWFSYPPDLSRTDQYFVVHDVSEWRVLFVPIALIVTWAAISIWVLGSPRTATS